VGGCDDLFALERRGELDGLLTTSSTNSTINEEREHG
jgi:hypothetical protein